MNSFFTQKNIAKTQHRVLILLSILITGLFSACFINSSDNLRDEGIHYANYYSSPDWYPDGKWIAAVHSDSVNHSYFFGTWLVDAETGESYPFVEHLSYPKWSKNGLEILGMMNNAIVKFQVISVDSANIDANSLEVIAPDYIAFDAVWGFADSTILFASHTYTHFYSIFKYDYSTYQDLTNEPDSLGFGDIRSPSTGRYCNSIAHIRYTSGTYFSEIYTMDMMGNNSRRITNNDFEDYSPVISNNGDKIIWTRFIKGRPRICFISLSGGEEKYLTSDGASQAAWSPQDDKIVFVKSPGGGDLEGSGQLWIMNEDGSNGHQLTFSKE